MGIYKKEVFLLGVSSPPPPLINYSCLRNFNWVVFPSPFSLLSQVYKILRSQLVSGFCSISARSMSPAGVSLLRKEILSCRALWYLRRDRGVFPCDAVCSFSIWPTWMSLLNASNITDGRTDSFWNTLIFLPYMTHGERNIQGQRTQICVQAALSVSRVVRPCVWELRELPLTAPSQEVIP